MGRPLLDSGADMPHAVAQPNMPSAAVMVMVACTQPPPATWGTRSLPASSACAPSRPGVGWGRVCRRPSCRLLTGRHVRRC
jgi:hypothetical protein